MDKGEGGGRRGLMLTTGGYVWKVSVEDYYWWTSGEAEYCGLQPVDMCER